MIENRNNILIRICFGEKCDAFALIQVITLNSDIPFCKAVSLAFVQRICQSSQASSRDSSLHGVIAAAYQKYTGAV